ncbi:MAG: PEP-CTERM sorting domain-containing protein [Alkalinema sp. RU_4_3]|nr:PEP-CTERM sorting domain-containing protein [Alkalinema sp. RU_4_3]
MSKTTSQSSRISKRSSSAIACLSPIAAGAILLLAAPAQAFQLGFNNITGNSATNALAGSNQLKIDITDASGGESLTSSQVLFKFSNMGTAASSITQIYFDNGTSLKSINSIFDSGSTVDFSKATGNLNLPGGNSLTSKFVSDFGVKANGAVSQMGVNNGTAGQNEWLSVLFDLGANKTLKSVMDEIQAGNLRIGMHVQAFSNGGSEAFVNALPPIPKTEIKKKVPEPGTIAALSTMAIVAALKRRQQTNSRKA